MHQHVVKCSICNEATVSETQLQQKVEYSEAEITFHQLESGSDSYVLVVGSRSVILSETMCRIPAGRIISEPLRTI